MEMKWTCWFILKWYGSCCLHQKWSLWESLMLCLCMLIHSLAQSTHSVEDYTVSEEMSHRAEWPVISLCTKIPALWVSLAFLAAQVVMLHITIFIYFCWPIINQNKHVQARVEWFESERDGWMAGSNLCVTMTSGFLSCLLKHRECWLILAVSDTVNTLCRSKGL